MARSILIVDGDASFIGEIATHVREQGGKGHIASTFREGLRLLQTERPDVLVTALQLGAYNGLHLVLRGRADLPQLVTIVTGPNDPTVEREALALGATGYLVEPVDASAVAEAVQKLTGLTDTGEDDGSAAPLGEMLEASMG